MSEHQKEELEELHLVENDKELCSSGECLLPLEATSDQPIAPTKSSRHSSLLSVFSRWFILLITILTFAAWMYIDSGMYEGLLSRYGFERLHLIWPGIWLKVIEPIAVAFERGIWGLLQFQPGYSTPPFAIIVGCSLVLVLLPVYLIHICRNDSLSRKQKLLWSAVMITMASLFVPLPLLVYWFKYMRTGARTK